MKKIIFLLIGFLFPSVYAANFNNAEITEVTAELMHNTKFVETCRALYQQGLTAEQIVEQLMLSNKICLHEFSDCRFEPMSSEPSLLGFFVFPIVLVVVGYVGLVISSCCEELLKEEKK